MLPSISLPVHKTFSHFPISPADGWKNLIFLWKKFDKHLENSRKSRIFVVWLEQRFKASKTGPVSAAWADAQNHTTSLLTLGIVKSGFGDFPLRAVELNLLLSLKRRLVNVKDEETTAVLSAIFTRDVCKYYTYFWPMVHVMWADDTRDDPTPRFALPFPLNGRGATAGDPPPKPLLPAPPNNWLPLSNA